MVIGSLERVQAQEEVTEVRSRQGARSCRQDWEPARTEPRRFRMKL